MKKIVKDTSKVNSLVERAGEQSNVPNPKQAFTMQDILSSKKKKETTKSTTVRVSYDGRDKIFVLSQIFSKSNTAETVDTMIEKIYENLKSDDQRLFNMLLELEQARKK